MLLIKNP